MGDCEMIIEGNAICLGDDINTDIIYPGKYLTITNRTEQALHVMEGLGEDWPQQLTKYSVVVAGWNFGCGSSREQAATALLGAGVKLVIAASFSRLFFRNCINNGLPVIESHKLSQVLSPDDYIYTDLSLGKAEIKKEIYAFEPLPSNLIAIVQNGGLLSELSTVGDE